MKALRILIVVICHLATLNREAFGHNQDDCDVSSDFEVSPADYFDLAANCYQPTSRLPVHVNKVSVTLEQTCGRILYADYFITNATSLTHVFLWDYYNRVEVLDGGTFRQFVNVIELSLVGFVKLNYVNGDVFKPLQALERLFLKGFGFNYLKYKDVGLALAGLSGTPLKVIVMDRIHGVLSPGKYLDLNDLFQIENVSLQTWVFSNNLVTEYIGVPSLVLPDLQYFCMGIAGPIDFVSYSELTLDLLIRSRNLTTFILYPLAIGLIDKFITGDWSGEGFRLLNRSLFFDFIRFPNPECYLGFELPMSPSLKRFAVRGDLIYYPTNGQSICVHQPNQIESFVMYDSSLKGVMPAIHGLMGLKTLAVHNMNIRKFPISFLKYLPSLEAFTVSQLSLEGFVSTINSSFFGYATSLRIIDLIDCNLTKIPRQTFDLLPQLYQLNVSKNRLSEFDVSMNCSGSLTVLDLSRNALRTLPKNVTDCLSAIADTRRLTNDILTVNLAGNTLSCLCNNTYFVGWINASYRIRFPGIETYACILPNGSRASVREVDVNELENQCEFTKKIINESDCPCDDITRDQLKRMPLSFDGYFCRNVKGELIAMNSPLPACINIYLTPQFLTPVVVVGLLIVALVTSIVLLYRYRHNERLQPIVECLGIERIVGMALRLLMLTVDENQASFTHDIFLYVHQLDYRVENTIKDKLSTSRNIITQSDIVGGAFVLDALNECTKRCQWIVPVLTPAFVSDRHFVFFINRVLFDRPHALVPVVWTPLTADSCNRKTINELFKLGDPLCWPGDGDAENMCERRDSFWMTLLNRTDREMKIVQ